MRITQLEGNTERGKKRERKKKRKSEEDTVAWVAWLILTQGTSEDMGSVSNQEFPGGVTKKQDETDVSLFSFFSFLN